MEVISLNEKSIFYMKLAELVNSKVINSTNKQKTNSVAISQEESDRRSWRG
jgi:hypothetical protein